MRNKTAYFIFFGIIILGVIIIEFFSPKELNWRPSFSQKHKWPYGAYALRQTLPDIAGGNTIINVDSTAYQFLGNGFDSIYANVDKYTYVIIDEYARIDESDLIELLGFVSKGNKVFISSNGFSNLLMDTLFTNYSYTYIPMPQFGLVDNDKTFITTRMANPEFGEKHYRFNYGRFGYYLNFWDHENTTVLGFEDSTYVNYLKVKFGEGEFYLHCSPFAFTNINFLEGSNHKYAAKVFSYFNDTNIIWDEHYKSTSKHSLSPFQVILTNENLTWGLYLITAGIIAMFVFGIKRRQRIIPVIPSPRNTTVDFVKTISELYFNSATHKSLAGKKIKHFREFIRTRFYINIREFNTNEIIALAGKTGMTEKKVAKLFSLIREIQSLSFLSTDQLIELNNMMQEFYKKGKYGTTKRAPAEWI